MPLKIELPEVPEAERTPLIDTLLGLIELLVQENSKQAETIQQLRDEIAILKGEKAKPKFRPSGMKENAGSDSDDDEQDGDSSGEDSKKKRPGSQKRAKKKTLPIHETKIVEPLESVPEGSVCKGYEDFVAQDIRIEAHNICYRREIWITLDGRRLSGELPDYQNLC